VNGYAIKGVYSLEPITVELKNLFVKTAVVGISVLDFKLYNISVEPLAYISPFIKDSRSAIM
jgi:hypothetical protein